MTGVSAVTGQRVAASRRIAAIVALIAAACAVAFVMVFLLRNAAHLLLGLVGLIVAAAGGWVALTERGLKRPLGVGLLVVGLGVIVVALAAAWDGQQGILARFILVLLLLAITLITGRYAVRDQLTETDLENVRVKAPSRAVLLVNPWSGGGKVDQFDIPRLARDLGVEVVRLDHGLDLEQLARDAVTRGADCLGMAGGDGSQALVAGVAIDAGLPFVVVPAGTRNHLALDLSLDRTDPRPSLRGFVDGHERRIDYATVNDRLFVNNVSLGVYASIVQSDDYRDNKVGTATDLLPNLLGTDTEPFDLQFTGPEGQEVHEAFLVQVSNNQYTLSNPLDFGQRLALEDGLLGMVAVAGETTLDGAQFMTRLATNTLNRSPNYIEWNAEHFEVRSRAATVDAGVDGEACRLETPLKFRIHPAGLRLLVPRENIEAAVVRRSRAVRTRDLIAIAQGNQISRER